MSRENVADRERSWSTQVTSATELVKSCLAHYDNLKVVAEFPRYIGSVGELAIIESSEPDYRGEHWSVFDLWRVEPLTGKVQRTVRLTGAEAHALAAMLKVPA